MTSLLRTRWSQMENHTTTYSDARVIRAQLFLSFGTNEWRSIKKIMLTVNCLYWAESSEQLKSSTFSLIENTKARQLKMWLCSCNFRALLFVKLTQMAKAWHWIISWVQHTALSSMGRVKTWAQEIFISLVITSGLLAELYHCFWAGFAWAKMECLICLAISLFFWLVYPFHQMHFENIYFTV